MIEYELFLTTSSKEIAALKTCDEARVIKIRADIEKAIASPSNLAAPG